MSKDAVLKPNLNDIQRELDVHKRAILSLNELVSKLTEIMSETNKGKNFVASETKKLRRQIDVKDLHIADFMPIKE